MEAVILEMKDKLKQKHLFIIKDSPKTEKF